MQRKPGILPEVKTSQIKEWPQIWRAVSGEQRGGV